MKKFAFLIIVAFVINFMGLIYTVSGEMDNAAYCLFISIFAVMGIAIWKIMRYDEKEEVAENENVNITGYNNIPIDKNTSFNIMKKALAVIGCQPSAIDEDSISVAYQGESFYIKCTGLYATIWDLSWSYIEANDLELPKIREAVNATNVNFGHAVVLGEPDDKGNIDFHTKRNIMLHPSLPDAPEYIKAELDNFFPIKDRLKEAYHQIDLKQKEAQKERRPIGFTTQD